MNNKPTALYRHYDKDGILLYVGISLSAWNRFLQHKNNTDWSYISVRMDIEWFGTLEDAYESEKQAIKNENPIHNIRYSLRIRSRPQQEILEPDDNSVSWRWIISQIQEFGLTEKKIAWVVNTTQQNINRLKREITVDPRWELGQCLISFNDSLHSGPFAKAR